MGGRVLNSHMNEQKHQNNILGNRVFKTIFSSD